MRDDRDFCDADFEHPMDAIRAARRASISGRPGVALAALITLGTVAMIIAVLLAGGR